MADDNHIGVMRSGIPVDVHGGPTIDPTKNVLDLVQAAVLRQDDLREALSDRLESSVGGLKTLLESYDLRYEQRYDAMNAQIQAALIAQKDALHAALQAAERAVLKSEASTEKRFDGVDTFRNSLESAQRSLMPRQEAQVMMEALKTQLYALENSLKAQAYALEKQLDAMKSETLGQFNTMKSEQAGVRGGWGYAVGAIGFFLAIGSLIMMGVRFVLSNP